MCCGPVRLFGEGPTSVAECSVEVSWEEDSGLVGLDVDKVGSGTRPSGVAAFPGEA